MRTFLSACLAASMFAMLPAGGAYAAIETVPDVVGSCPIEERVGLCSNAVIDFLTFLPQEQLDEGIADVVAALVEAAKNPNISPYMCAELEDAIRLAGSAATTAAAQQEFAEVADALCEGKRLPPDRIVTGSIGGNSTNDGPPQSIVDQLPPSPDVPPPPTGGNPPACEIDCDDDEPTNVQEDK
jgi:hypothetical protein